MDAIAMLKQDHRKVEQLFKEFEALGEKAHKSRQKILAQIISALKVHAELEETIFYPAFRPEAEEEQDVLEAYEEHHVVKFLIRELEGMEPTHERYIAKAIVLKELVEHHVEEEEKEMFPEAKKALGASEIRALGERMMSAKPDVERRMAAGAPHVSVTMLRETRIEQPRER